MKFAITMIIIILIAGCMDCDKAVSEFKNEDGAFRINEIVSVTSRHCLAFKSATGALILYPYGTFVKYPEIGDSIVKRKDEITYLLIHKDSSFLMWWDCSIDDYGIKAWKTDEFYLKSRRLLNGSGTCYYRVRIDTFPGSVGTVSDSFFVPVRAY